MVMELKAGGKKAVSGDRLREIFEALPEAPQATLLDFAEFLAARHPPAHLPMGEPEDIPRPPRESVVKAIKRLSATYPMLDRSTMLNDTSSLMSQHIMQGRSAKEVIDDLEALFHREYEKQRSSDS